jgi:hypothetical protein
MDHSTHHPHAQTTSACCANKPTESAPASRHAHHAHHAHGNSSPASLATAATLHCLTGCVIGEFIGLAIGVSLGMSPWATIVLATALSYVSGFSLGLLPLVRQGMSFMKALRTIWLGEVISIAVMEIAMNFADYHVGGMNANSMLDPMFWLGFAVAVPAGFIAAWPVNWWMLKRDIKKPCH